MNAGLPLDVLDAVLPLHLIYDGDGRVTRVGRTLARIAPGALGRSLAQVIVPVRPAFTPTAAALGRRAGRRLALRFPGEARGEAAPTEMRATVHPLPGGGGLLVVCFGADVAAGVARHALAATDFAELDQTIEILLLLELQAALLKEHARYAARLADAGTRAEHAAATDALTGLPNRRAIDDRLGRLAERSDAVYGLMQVDLDYFKAVNDGFGHGAGDSVLRHVAQVLRQEMRGSDMVARVGGDEFLVLVDGCDDPDRLRLVADRVIARLSEPIPVEGGRCRISASIGGGLSRCYAHPDPRVMIADIDAALYRAKEDGRARYSLAAPCQGAQA